MTQETEYNASRAEQFAERLISVLNDGALCLMTSIGHRTGLFDVMATGEPTTCAELAEQAGLNERYVREWLGAMVTGNIVELDAETERYRLPAEHAAWLTRNSPEGNIAVFAQYIPLLGAVEDDIVECFRKGGGVPYSRFLRFHEVMAEDSGQTVLAALDEHILPLVEGITDRLDAGIDVLDVGCGSGRALVHLARRFPNSRFMGIDLSDEAVRTGKQEAKSLGLGNLSYEARDLSGFDRDAQPEAFDFVTAFDAIHDQARPRSVLKGIWRTLRPDGVFLMQDIRASGHHDGDREHPIGPLLYTISCMHCMTVSLAQGGEGLGAMWGEAKARELLGEAGFRDVATHTLAHDFQNNFYVIRK